MEGNPNIEENIQENPNIGGEAGHHTSTLIDAFGTPPSRAHRARSSRTPSGRPPYCIGIDLGSTWEKVAIGSGPPDQQSFQSTLLPMSTKNILLLLKGRASTRLRNALKEMWAGEEQKHFEEIGTLIAEAIEAGDLSLVDQSKGGLWKVNFTARELTDAESRKAEGVMAAVVLLYILHAIGELLPVHRVSQARDSRPLLGKDMEVRVAVSSPSFSGVASTKNVQWQRAVRFVFALMRDVPALVLAVLKILKSWTDEAIGKDQEKEVEAIIRHAGASAMDGRISFYPEAYAQAFMWQAKGLLVHPCTAFNELLQRWRTEGTGALLVLLFDMGGSACDPTAILLHGDEHLHVLEGRIPVGAEAILEAVWHCVCKLMRVMFEKMAEGRELHNGTRETTAEMSTEMKDFPPEWHAWGSERGTESEIPLETLKEWFGHIDKNGNTQLGPPVKRRFDWKRGIMFDVKDIEGADPIFHKVFADRTDREVKGPYHAMFVDEEFCRTVHGMLLSHPVFRALVDGLNDFAQRAMQRARQDMEMLRSVYAGDVGPLSAVDNPVVILEGSAHPILCSIPAESFKQLQAVFQQRTRVFSSTRSMSGYDWKSNMAVGLMHMARLGVRDVLECNAVWGDETQEQKFFRMQRPEQDSGQRPGLRSVGTEHYRGPNGEVWFEARQLTLLPPIGTYGMKHHFIDEKDVAIRITFAKSSLVRADLTRVRNVEPYSPNQGGDANAAQDPRVQAVPLDPTPEKDTDQACFMLPSPQHRRQLLLVQDTPIQWLSKRDVIAAFERRFQGITNGSFAVESVRFVSVKCGSFLETWAVAKGGRTGANGIVPDREWRIVEIHVATHSPVCHPFQKYEIGEVRWVHEPPRATQQEAAAEEAPALDVLAADEALALDDGPGNQQADARQPYARPSQAGPARETEDAASALLDLQRSSGRPLAQAGRLLHNPGRGRPRRSASQFAATLSGMEATLVKPCNLCQETLPYAEFRATSTGPLRSYCGLCEGLRQKYAKQGVSVGALRQMMQAGELRKPRAADAQAAPKAHHAMGANFFLLPCLVHCRQAVQEEGPHVCRVCQKAQAGGKRKTNSRNSQSPASRREKTPRL